MTTQKLTDEDIRVYEAQRVQWFNDAWISIKHTESPCSACRNKRVIALIAPDGFPSYRPCRCSGGKDYSEGA
jgi:hypothetical protein